MIAKHAFTPGPWKFIEAAGTHIHTACDPYGRGPMFVAEVRGWGHLTGKGGGCAFDDEKAMAIQEANARLIAAAPELHERLRDLIEIIDKAGLLNLSNGVQLGATSWYVKASDRLSLAKDAIARADGGTPVDTHPSSHIQRAR